MSFLLISKNENVFRKEALHLFGKVFFISLFAMSLSAWWYFAVVPSAFKTHAIVAVLTPAFSQQPGIFYAINALGVFVMFIIAFSAFKGSVTFSKIFIVPALILCFGFVTEFERVREFIRGPFLMPGYMYANQILLDESLYFKKDGMLKNDYWSRHINEKSDIKNQGSYLFGRNCSVCHTIGGINSIQDAVKGRSEDGIFVILGHTHEMVPFMPPFSGTEEERQIMSRFLYQLANGKITIEAPSRFVSIKQETGK